MTGADANPWGPPGQGESGKPSGETFPEATPEPEVHEPIFSDPPAAVDRGPAPEPATPYVPAHPPDVDPKPFEKASPMLSWGTSQDEASGTPGDDPAFGGGSGSGGGPGRFGALAGRRRLIGLVALAIVVIAVGVSTLLGGDDAKPKTKASTKIAPTQVTETSPEIAQPKEVAPPTAEDQLSDGHIALKVTHKQLLRTRPAADGRLVRVVGSKTPYGGPNVLPIVKARGDWVAVVSPYRKNNKVAWTKVQPGSKFVAVEYSISIRLSKHTIVVRKNGKIVHRFNTAIGRTGHATPKGRFSVTDGLIFKVGDRAIYGCCALVLSARQPDLPAGWSGGDRIAMHGTPDKNSIGLAASLGCLRVGDEASRWLVRKVPAGATVFIKA